MPRRSPLPCLALIVGLVGCADLDRFKECRRLADAANPTLAEIEQLASQAGEPSAAVYGQLAERYRKLRTAVRKLDVKDERLRDAITAYLDMTTLAEKQLRQSATALTIGKEKVDAKEQLRRHQSAMATALSQQVTVQGRLRSLCKP